MLINFLWSHSEPVAKNCYEVNLYVNFIHQISKVKMKDIIITKLGRSKLLEVVNSQYSVRILSVSASVDFEIIHGFVPV